MLLVQKRGRGRTRGGFGLDTIHNGEQGTASREASDMSECVLGMGPHLSQGTLGLACWRSFRVPGLTDPAREGKSHKVLLL